MGSLVSTAFPNKPAPKPRRLLPLFRLSRFLQIPALILLLTISAHPESRPAAKGFDEFICGTPGYVHRRSRTDALSSLNGLTTTDVGNTAVLEDDGTVLIQPNRFDLI